MSFIVIGLLAPFMVPAAEDALPVRLLQPVMYHGDEVEVEDGQRWWGLYRSPDGGFELVESTVRVEIVEDPIVDNEGEATGKNVTVEGDRHPLVLFRGLATPTPGRVKTAFHGARYLGLGEMLSLTLDSSPVQRGGTFGDRWHLGATGTARETEYGLATQDYGLVLFQNLGTDGAQRQRLADFDTIDLDGAPRLLWAGDLDRDGRLDLLFDLSYHYNVSVLTLFLSSASGEGAIVGRVGDLETTGC